MGENDGKKKMSPLAWAGIGCGVVAVIGLIVMALLVGMCKRKAEEMVKDFEANPAKTMAEMAVRANPDVELVRSDDAAGTITVREKKTGKETTVNFEDAKDGKFTIESEGTTATLDGSAGTLTSEGPDGKSSFNVGGLEKMPQWFEVPEGVTAWKSITHQEREGKVNGIVAGQSSEKLEDLLAAFEASLKAAGFARTSKTETGEFTMASFQDKAKQRTVSVTLNPKKDAMVVQMTYMER